jgi:DNA-binding transcriptional MerR regulator
MDDHRLYSIGELAQLTGSSVTTIRFYSDAGLVQPADRTPAGYRRYDDAALARLRLVRSLRDLGLDLAAIRNVMNRELALSEVATAHAEALDVQIRILRLRRAVLTAVANRGATAEETTVMHRLATLTEAERRRLVDGFLDAVFGGAGSDPAFDGFMRTLTPELPDDPDLAQLQAWVELAELAQDPDFRAYMRRLVEIHAARQVPGGPPTRDRDLTATVRDQVSPAARAGIEPTSPAADAIVSVLLSRCAPLLEGNGDVESRRLLLVRLDTLNDPRRERYLDLLAVINRWPALDSLQPVLDWAIAALRARTRL